MILHADVYVLCGYTILKWYGIYIYIYVGNLKTSKPLPEKRAITKHFCFGNTTISYKTKKKYNWHICFNFCAADAKGEVCVTNLKIEKTQALVIIEYLKKKGKTTNESLKT